MKLILPPYAFIYVNYPLRMQMLPYTNIYIHDLNIYEPKKHKSSPTPPTCQSLFETHANHTHTPQTHTDTLVRLQNLNSNVKLLIILIIYYIYHSTNYYYYYYSYYHYYQHYYYYYYYLYFTN